MILVTKRLCNVKMDVTEFNGDLNGGIIQNYLTVFTEIYIFFLSVNVFDKQTKVVFFSLVSFS